MTNEIGTSAARGRPVVSNDDAARLLSELAGEEIRLGSNIVSHGGPETCPACGSRNVMWGCDDEQTRSREEIHRLVWHETEWMADSFICRDCWTGWIEPDDPSPITWVRPYWRA